MLKKPKFYLEKKKKECSIQDDEEAINSEEIMR